MKIDALRICASSALFGFTAAIVIRPGGTIQELSHAVIQDDRLSVISAAVYTPAGTRLAYGTFKDGPGGLSGVILSTGKVQDAAAGYLCSPAAIGDYERFKRSDNQCVPSTNFGGSYYESTECLDLTEIDLEISSTEDVELIGISLIFATGERLLDGSADKFRVRWNRDPTTDFGYNAREPFNSDEGEILGLSYPRTNSQTIGYPMAYSNVARQSGDLVRTSNLNIIVCDVTNREVDSAVLFALSGYPAPTSATTTPTETSTAASSTTNVPISESGLLSTASVTASFNSRQSMETSVLFGVSSSVFLVCSEPSYTSIEYSASSSVESPVPSGTPDLDSIISLPPVIPTATSSTLSFEFMTATTQNTSGKATGGRTTLVTPASGADTSLSATTSLSTAITSLNTTTRISDPSAGITVSTRSTLSTSTQRTTRSSTYRNITSESSQSPGVATMGLDVLSSLPDGPSLTRSIVQSSTGFTSSPVLERSTTPRAELQPATISTAPPTQSTGFNLPRFDDHYFRGCLGSEAGYPYFNEIGKDDAMTPQKCTEMAGNLRYAGVFFDTCYGSDSLDLTTFVPATNCAIQCPGDRQQICGGNAAINIPRVVARQFRSRVSKRAVPSSILLTIYERILEMPGSSATTSDTPLRTITAGDDLVLPSTPTTVSSSTAVTNAGAPAIQSSTVQNSQSPDASPRPSSFTGVFIIESVQTTFAGAFTSPATASSSPAIAAISGSGDDGDVLDPSSSVELAGSQTVPNVGFPTAGSGAGTGDDGDVLEPLTTTLGFSTSRTSPNIGVDMPITSVVTTITYTTINPANPTAPMETELCSTLYFPDCGCPTQVIPTIPMTTIEASCNKCGSNGESLVTLTVPESPYGTQESTAQDHHRPVGSNVPPQNSHLHTASSQPQPNTVPADMASTPTGSLDAGKPNIVPQPSIVSPVSAGVAPAAGSGGPETSANQENASNGTGSQDVYDNAAASPVNPAASVGSAGAASIYTVTAAIPTEAVSSSSPKSPAAGSSDVSSAGPGVGSTGPGPGSVSGPGSDTSSGEEHLPPSPTQPNTGGSASSKPSTVVVSSASKMWRLLEDPIFAFATLLSVTLVHFLT